MWFWFATSLSFVADMVWSFQLILSCRMNVRSGTVWSNLLQIKSTSVLSQRKTLEGHSLWRQFRASLRVEIPANKPRRETLATSLLPQAHQTFLKSIVTEWTWTAVWSTGWWPRLSSQKGLSDDSENASIGSTVMLPLTTNVPRGPLNMGTTIAGLMAPTWPLCWAYKHREERDLFYILPSALNKLVHVFPGWVPRMPTTDVQLP